MSVRRLAAFAIGALLLGCSDDPTGPATLDLRLAALTFDVLERSRTETGDGLGATAAQHAAMALRAGVRPTRVSITVDGTTDEYWALEVEHAFGDDLTLSPVLTVPIVLRQMVAWRGDEPRRVISISVVSDTGTFTRFQALDLVLPGNTVPLFPSSFGVLFERGSWPFLAESGGARATRGALGAECPLPAPRRSLARVATPVLSPTSCHRATFSTRFTMVVRHAPLDGAAALTTRTVSMADHTIEGIQLKYPLPELCLACLAGTR